MSAMPRVLFMHPPNFKAIHAAFNVRGKPIIFAFAGAIYNPHRIRISPALVAHEMVHLERQGDHPGHWWDRYISDVAFRLEEEIPAHRAEYESICASLAYDASISRGKALVAIAERLASPLYGNMIDMASAQRLIRHGETEGIARHAL